MTVAGWARFLVLNQPMGSAKAENRLQREGSEDMAAISWKTPVSGDWNVAADWSTGAVPISADDVLISAPGSYTVTISTNQLIVPPWVAFWLRHQ
jgi:hypothetical protein